MQMQLQLGFISGVFNDLNATDWEKDDQDRYRMIPLVSLTRDLKWYRAHVLLKAASVNTCHLYRTTLGLNSDKISQYGRSSYATMFSECTFSESFFLLFWLPLIYRVGPELGILGLLSDVLFSSG